MAMKTPKTVCILYHSHPHKLYLELNTRHSPMLSSYARAHKQSNALMPQVHVLLLFPRYKVLGLSKMSGKIRHYYRRSSVHPLLPQSPRLVQRQRSLARRNEQHPTHPQLRGHRRTPPVLAKDPRIFLSLVRNHNLRGLLPMRRGTICLILALARRQAQGRPPLHRRPLVRPGKVDPMLMNVLLPHRQHSQPHRQEEDLRPLRRWASRRLKLKTRSVPLCDGTRNGCASPATSTYLN